ncbi:hypothetical protein TSH7_06090 [Azospirillum sp. TSH7]|uniref:hypothetical protein n=1 Tax=unclassified Azospirillum TaxID=2630922 RepID=UPI000D606885|nr:MULTISPECIES: hypothetical protein [unclassified Azospirillum]PWC66699.1 hypothetical protein TSH7_06090 [Azospirillum sp. TSH7]PWC70562.1 hypothetical protein TSH20_06535 [Azospirillum sp. TSH20]
MSPRGILYAGLTAAALSLATAPASAQTQPPRPGPVPLTPDATRDRPVVDLSLCQRLTRHVPAADVEYRPGVDVHGRAVAPADLAGSAGAQPPIPIDLPLSVDLARRMGIALPSVPFLPDDVTAVWLTVVGNQLYLNGQPIDPGAEERLYVYCRSR